MDSDGDITGLLTAWRAGDRVAFERLVPRVERELRRIARLRLRKSNRESTLTTTSLVQEVYLRLIRGGKVNWQGRAHFFALCAEIMRGVLVDHARARHAVKRGGGALHVALDEASVISDEHNETLLAIDEALRDLGKVDPRKARVIEMRFFGGLTAGETAEVLQISAESVERDWRLGRMWLLRRMDGMGRQDARGVAAR